MSEFPSFSINHWPGCAKAKLQAVQTADRRLSAAVTAVASYEMTGKLFGTLSNAPESRVSTWIDEVCRDHSAPREYFELWAASLCGERFPFKDKIPSVVRGIGPPDMRDITLDQYQITAVCETLLGGGAIGSFLGSGKTAIGTAAAMAIGLSLPGGMGELCAVECSLNAFPAWERAKPELLRCFKKVLIFSVDSVHKYKSLIGDVLICDEAHKLGTNGKRRTDSTHIMRAHFRYCIPLTGSLLHAGVAKVLSIKDLAVPGLSLFARTWTAGETFDCLVRKKIGARTVTDLAKPPSHTREDFLAWLSMGVQFITEDNEAVQSVFKLPGQDMQEVNFGTPWPPLEVDVAAAANAAFAETGEFPHAQAVKHMLLRAGIEQKLEWLSDEIQELGTAQLVIFSQYRESLDRAEEMIRGLGVTYVRVDGDIVKGERTECERKFQSGEAQLFLGQLHAASESMNLQCATLSVTIDVNNSCIDYSQSLGRTHRRGQNIPCLHVDLVSNVLQARALDCLRSNQDFAADAAANVELKQHLERTRREMGIDNLPDAL